MGKKLVAVFALVLLMGLMTGCVVQSQPAKAGNQVTMGPNNYISGNTITIKKGQTITFVDDTSTGTEHILVIGVNGAAKTEAGAPDFGASGHTFQPGNSWVSPPWTTEGTFDVTCTIHPTTMNLKVMVTA
jgi:plastocyanin